MFCKATTLAQTAEANNVPGPICGRQLCLEGKTSKALAWSTELEVRERERERERASPSCWVVMYAGGVWICGPRKTRCPHFTFHPVHSICSQQYVISLKEA